MSEYPHWAVLAPGEPTWLEQRARAALGLDDEEDGEVELPFKIAPGGSHYHALIGLEDTGVGDEMLIAEQLSLVCVEPVYSIEQASPPAVIFEYRNGVGEILELEDSQELALSLGCPFPKSEEAPDQEAPRPLRKAALVEGVHSQEALRVLEEEDGHPLPPGCLRLEDTPKGLIIADGTGGLGFAHITLSDRFPLSAVYGVMASPSLDIFTVTVLRGAEGLGQFAQPPRESSFYPPVSEIKGERTPERILAALGIPAEWFR
jgi:hypothetical protein